MGAFGGPDIVEDGLMFAVDAGSTRSYPNPGTGTAVNSLVSSITGSLANGVGFSTNNGGTWDFDGVDDIIFAGDGTDYAYPYHSWEMWFKTSQVDSGGVGA